MTGNASSELMYARALVELGATKASRIVDFDPPVTLDPDSHLSLSDLTPELLHNFIGSDQRIVFPARRTEGSNNWTIAGKRTSSGKPLLANDPHRVVGLPSLRYMVHLVAPGWNVIGAGEPGLPGVARPQREYCLGFHHFRARPTGPLYREDQSRQSLAILDAGRVEKHDRCT
jgi:penicillin amidase